MEAAIACRDKMSHTRKFGYFEIVNILEYYITA